MSNRLRITKLQLFLASWSFAWLLLNVWKGIWWLVVLHLFLVVFQCWIGRNSYNSKVRSAYHRHRMEILSAQSKILSAKLQTRIARINQSTGTP